MDTCQLSWGHHGRQSPDCHRNWLYNKQHSSNTDIWPPRLGIIIFQSAQAAHLPSVDVGIRLRTALSNSWAPRGYLKIVLDPE